MNLRDINSIPSLWCKEEKDLSYLWVFSKTRILVLAAVLSALNPQVAESHNLWYISPDDMNYFLSDEINVWDWDTLYWNPKVLHSSSQIQQIFPSEEEVEEYGIPYEIYREWGKISETQGFFAFFQPIYNTLQADYGISMGGVDLLNFILLYTFYSNWDTGKWKALLENMSKMYTAFPGLEKFLLEQVELIP